MSQVTVLAPNGRRQAVKVTPNTTMLEIIEEVCKKQDLCADEYNLRHHRSILTASSTVRFCGIPQNGHLELVEAQFRRQESNVTLCIQLESGKRVQGDCLPSESLWDVITRMAPEISELASPVIIFMRREVVGKDALKNTTLRTIGLTEGRAIIRVVNRTIEELRTQANVSAPLPKPPPPPQADIEEAGSNLSVISESSETTGNTVEPITKTPKTSSENTNLVLKSSESDLPVTAGEIDAGKTTTQEERVGATGNISNEFTQPKAIVDVLDEKKEQMEVKESSKSMEIENKSEVEKTEISAFKEMDGEAFSTTPDAVEKVILLGERNAIAYSLDSAPPSEPEDLPDDFFELTLQDVRSLYAARRATVEELVNAPMLTSQQRQLDHDGTILKKLSQYKSCVIRVRLPDRTVLQGIFKPIDTILSVKEFVKDYLAAKDLEYYLYTAPPKQILNDELKLIEVDCVPSANLYLGLDSLADHTGPFLRSDVVEKFSTPTSAYRIAKEARGQPPAQEVKPSGSRKTPLASTISTTPRSSDSPPQKIPKWLKLAK